MHNCDDKRLAMSGFELDTSTPQLQVTAEPNEPSGRPIRFVHQISFGNKIKLSWLCNLGFIRLINHSVI